MEYFKVLMVWCVCVCGGVFTFLVHSQWPDRAPVWEHRRCRGSAEWRIRSLSSLAVVCSDMQPVAPVPRHFPKRRHWSQSELRCVARRCLHRTSQWSVVCWGSGLWPQLTHPPTTYNITSQLSGMFLASLPPHTCHDTSKLSQAGLLRQLLNQIAQTRSQITIRASNHPHPQCPVLSLVILAHLLGPERQLHKVWVGERCCCTWGRNFNLSSW